MKRSKKALLIALVIGDGFIRIDKRLKNPKSAELNLCHSTTQREYLQFKVDLLHSLLGGRKPILREYMCTSFGGKAYKQVRASKCHRYFKILHGWMYPEKYTTKYLEYLTPQALAIWFMDDGSCVPNNRYKDGTTSTCRTNLHICTTREKAEEVCKYFMDTWGIKWTTFLEREGNFSIRCFHKAGRAFHELIHPYIIPSMAYKQRFYYSQERIAPESPGDDIVSSHGNKNHEG